MYNGPDGREQELEGLVRFNVRKLAGRIDVGYNFSARIGPLPESENEEEPTEEYKQKEEITRAIKESTSKIEYRKVSDEPVLPISWQPDSEDGNDNQSG